MLDTAAPEPLVTSTDAGAAKFQCAAPEPSLCFSWPRPSIVEGKSESESRAMASNEGRRWSIPAAALVSVELDAAGCPRRYPRDPHVSSMIVGGELTKMVSAVPLLTPTSLPPRPEAAMRVALPLQAIPLAAFRALLAQDVTSATSPLGPLWLALALLAAEGGCPGKEDHVSIPLQSTLRGPMQQVPDDREVDALVTPGEKSDS